MIWRCYEGATCYAANSTIIFQHRALLQASWERVPALLQVPSLRHPYKQNQCFSMPELLFASVNHVCYSIMHVCDCISHVLVSCWFLVASCMFMPVEAMFVLVSWYCLCLYHTCLWYQACFFVCIRYFVDASCEFVVQVSSFRTRIKHVLWCWVRIFVLTWQKWFELLRTSRKIIIAEPLASLKWGHCCTSTIPLFYLKDRTFFRPYIHFDQHTLCTETFWKACVFNFYENGSNVYKFEHANNLLSLFMHK